MSEAPEGMPRTDPSGSLDGAVTRAVRCVVRGHVQGVGYRYFVARHAQRLQVAGWVRNCADGTVEVVVAAKPSILDEFVGLLQNGHPPARVVEVQHHQTVVDVATLRGQFDIRG